MWLLFPRSRSTDLFPIINVHVLDLFIFFFERYILPSFRLIQCTKLLGTHCCVAIFIPEIIGNEMLSVSNSQSRFSNRQKLISLISVNHYWLGRKGYVQLSIKKKPWTHRTWPKFFKTNDPPTTRTINGAPYLRNLLRFNWVIITLISTRSKFSRSTNFYWLRPCILNGALMSILCIWHFV